MTRTLYSRRSLFMRFVSAFVALTFTLSLAGSGYAAPNSDRQAERSGVSEEQPQPEAETPSAPEEEADHGSRQQEKHGPDPSVEAPPTTTDPPHRGPGQAKGKVEAAAPSGPSGGSEAVAALAAPPSEAPTAVADFTYVNWEAWRVSPASQVGWAKSNLGQYKEGDWIPLRIIVDNSKGAGPVTIPSFETAFDYLDGTKNAVGIDDATGFCTYITSTGSLPGDAPSASGARDASGDFSTWVNGGTAYLHVKMTPGTTLAIPKGEYGVIYFQVHLAISQYWERRGHEGAMAYPGSSAQGRFLSWNDGGVGDKTISLPVGPAVAPDGEINGVKFNDLDHDGVKDTGEEGLAGWTFTIDYGGEYAFTTSTVSAAGGVFSFKGLPAGDYTLDETDQSPWVNSTHLPMSISLGRDEKRPVEVGNYIPDVTKTWSLSMDALPVDATAFVRYSVSGGAAVTTDLSGSGPYTASVHVPVGSTITDISWYIRYGTEEVLLGTSPDDAALTGDLTNPFTYDSLVSGRKLDAASEAGLSGWTIVLKRVVGAAETEYARCITADDGSYSFEDVIPGTYKLEEINQAGWLNTAAPSGTFTIANGTHHTSGTDFVNLFIQSSIDVVKTGVAKAHVGDRTPYTITVQNTGNYELTNVIVTDAMLALNTNIGSLAPGQTRTINASRTVLPTDPDPIPNTAAALGTTIFGGQVADDDDWSVDIIKPAISVVKTAAPIRAINPASVTYTYVVTNVGEDPLHSVTLTDDHLTVPGGSIGNLAAGASVTRTASTTLTATTTNIATASGVDELNATVHAHDDAVVGVFNPSIDIVKSASSSVVLPDGRVTYTYLVTNTGDIALHHVTVTDNVLGPIGTIPMLAPSTQVPLTYTATITADVTNIGTATGWYGLSGTEFYGSVTDSDPEFVDVVHPAIEIVKTGAPKPVVSGTTVTYTYTVYNRGDVALYDADVSDDQLGFIGHVALLPVSGSAQLTRTAALTHTTTNIASVSAHDEYMHFVTDDDDETIQVYNPDISIVKSVDKDRVVAGDTVTYSYLVTNEGDIALHDIDVTDDVLGAVATIPSLAPQASATVTKTATITHDVTNTGTAVGEYGTARTAFYGTVSDADDAYVDAISPGVELTKSAYPEVVVAGTSVTYTFVVHNSGDAPLYDLDVTDDHLGYIGTIANLASGASSTLTTSTVLTESTHNVAIVAGEDEFGNTVSDDDDADVAVFNPGISIVKSASDAVVLEGDQVLYTYLVTNTGDTTLYNVTVNDDILGAVGFIPSLAPQAFDTVSYLATIQSDVTNIGTATGWYGRYGTPFYGSVSDSDPESVDVIHPAIEVVKEGSPKPVVKGTTVTYTYTVYNRGDVALYDVAVTDDQLGSIGTVGTLPVGGSSTLSTSTALTVTTTNIATASGHDEYQNRVSDTDNETIQVYNPEISIVKTVDKDRIVAGDTVTYSYRVTNEGDITLHDIEVTDDVLGLIGTIDSLGPLASTTVTKSTSVQADVTNMGTAVGYYGTAETDFYGSVDDSDDAFVDTIHPDVEIIKTAAPEVVIPGTPVTYTFQVNNTGDAPLHDLAVTDDHLGTIGTITDLAAGSSSTLTTSTLLTVSTHNVATVAGEDEFGNPVDDTDDADVAVYNPSISIVKSASANTILSGDAVTYTYTVTNSGDIALFDIAVTDDVLGAIGVIPSLAPHAQGVVSATASITADVTNIGTALGWYGTPESDFYGSVQDSEPESVDVIHPAIGVVKTVAPTAIILGQSVTYTYVVSNSGDVDLFNVTLTDDHLGVVGTLETLAVEGSHTFTVTAAPSSSTTNVVEAVGFDRLQHRVSATDDAFVDVAMPFTGSPDMAIEKSADKTKVEPGDLVTYKLTYRNVGDADAVNVKITDDYDQRYMTVVDDGGATVADGKLVWTLPGPIAPNKSGVLTYQVRVSKDLPDGVTHIDNVVVIVAPDDRNPNNDKDDWRVDLSEPFLPFTGGDWFLMALAAILAAALGVALRRSGRTIA